VAVRAPASEILEVPDRERMPSRAAEPGDAPDAARARILVVESGTGEPIGGARITVRRKRAAPHELVTGTHGLARADVEGAVVLDVRAEGYAPAARAAELRSHGETLVELERGARLQVFFHDSGGAPLEGIEAMALPLAFVGDGRTPGLGLVLRTAIDESAQRGTTGAALTGVLDLMHLVAWTARADRTGTATWKDLPPGTYRWAASANVVPQPPHEGDPSGGASQPADGSVSGTFELVPGGSASFDGLVLRGGSVRGSLPEPIAEAGEVVFRRRDEDGVWRSSSGDRAEVRADGSFLHEDAPPGDYALHTRWTSPAHEILTAVRSFHLAAGETIDLGTLEPLKGDDLELDLRYVDEEDGHELGAEESWAAGLPERATLVELLQARAAIAASSAFERTSVEVPSRWILRGVPEGELQLRVELPPFWRVPGLVLVPPAQDLGTERPPVIALPIRLHHDHWIEIVCDDAPAKGVLALNVLSLADGARRDAILPPDAWPRQGALAPSRGAHLLIVHDESSPGPNLYGEARFEVGGDGPTVVPLALATGAILDGRALDESGAPLAEDHVALTCEPWSAHEGIWYADVDAEGRFRFTGLRPATTFHVVGSDEDVTTGGPGEERKVELRLGR